MARTNVPVLDTTPAGILDALAVDVALHVADGAMFTNDGHTYVLVNNTGAAAHIVTFVTPKLVQGLAVADAPFTIAAGKLGLFGPFDPPTFNQPSGADAGKIYVNADATQSEVLIVPFKG